MLNQTLCSLDDHFRNPFMPVREFIKGGINNLYIFADHGFFDVRYLLRALIDQKDNHMHIRVVGGNSLRNLL